MNIDAHQHYWVYNPEEFSWINEQMKELKRDYLPVDFMSEMMTAGFEGSIAVQARQCLEETEWLLQLADSYSYIKGVVGWVDLCSIGASEQLARFSSNPKFVGVRHVIHDESDDEFMLHKDFMEGIIRLSEFDLTYDILIYPRHLQNAIRFVEHFPDQRFILDHIGKPGIRKGEIDPWRKELKILGQFQNVYCKMSGMVTEADWNHWEPDHFRPYLDAVMDAFGARRLMIGSDWPVCTLAGSYAKVIELVLHYINSFTDEEKKNILGINAYKVYKLHP